MKALGAGSRPGRRLPAAPGPYIDDRVERAVCGRTGTAARHAGPGPQVAGGERERRDRAGLLVHVPAVRQAVRRGADRAGLSVAPGTELDGLLRLGHPLLPPVPVSRLSAGNRTAGRGGRAAGRWQLDARPRGRQLVGGPPDHATLARRPQGRRRDHDRRLVAVQTPSPRVRGVARSCAARPKAEGRLGGLPARR